MFLTRLLTGKVKLWQAWWLCWWLPLLFVSMGFAAIALNAHIYKFFWLAITLLCLQGVILIFGSVAVWRCAPNCQSPRWTYLARLLIVLAVLANAYKLKIVALTNIHWLFCSAMATSVSIVLVFLVGKLAKSNTLLNFFDDYFAPLMLVLGNSFIYIGTMAMFLHFNI